MKTTHRSLLPEFYPFRPTIFIARFGDTSQRADNQKPQSWVSLPGHPLRPPAETAGYRVSSNHLLTQISSAQEEGSPEAVSGRFLERYLFVPLDAKAAIVDLAYPPLLLVPY